MTVPLRRSWVRRALLPWLIAVPGVVWVAGQLGLFSGQPPADLGVSASRLKPPSDTRNSVSSQTALYPEHPQAASAAIAALPWREGDAKASMQALLRALDAQPRVTIIGKQPANPS